MKAGLGVRIEANGLAPREASEGSAASFSAVECATEGERAGRAYDRESTHAARLPARTKRHWSETLV